MSDRWTRLNRRMFTSGAGFTTLSRLGAFGSDFRNKTDPSEDEVQ